MIEPVFYHSIPQDDMRHQDSQPRRRPRKRSHEEHAEPDEPEDSFTHRDSGEDQGDDG